MPPTLLSKFRSHYPGALALLAFAIGGVFWFWVRQDTSVALNVFFGWRQIVVVLCTGLVVGGAIAELAALVARSSPGETPISSAVITAIFALPTYAVLILLDVLGLD